MIQEQEKRMRAWNSEEVRQYLTEDEELEKELKIEFDRWMNEEKVREWEEQAMMWTAKQNTQKMLFCINQARDIILEKYGEEAAGKAVASLVAGLLFDALKRQKEQGMVQEVLLHSYKDYMRWVRDYQKYHNGKIGLERQRWVLRTFSGELICLGSLQFERKTWDLPCVLLEHKETKSQKMLSKDGYKENADGFYGKQIRRQDGMILDEVVFLKKEEWDKKAESGTPVLGIHIPAGADLSHDAVIESLRLAKTYYGTENNHFLICESWLLDSHLDQILPSQSRILEFASLFWRTPIAEEEQVPQILERVFGEKFKMENLEKQVCVTRLQKALKEYLLSGGTVGSMGGCLSWNIVS